MDYKDMIGMRVDFQLKVYENLGQNLLVRISCLHDARFAPQFLVFFYPSIMTFSIEQFHNYENENI